MVRVFCLIVICVTTANAVNPLGVIHDVQLVPMKQSLLPDRPADDPAQLNEEGRPVALQMADVARRVAVVQRNNQQVDGEQNDVVEYDSDEECNVFQVCTSLSLGVVGAGALIGCCILQH